MPESKPFGFRERFTLPCLLWLGQDRYLRKHPPIRLRILPRSHRWYLLIWDCLCWLMENAVSLVFAFFVGFWRSFEGFPWHCVIIILITFIKILILNHHPPRPPPPSSSSSPPPPPSSSSSSSSSEMTCGSVGSVRTCKHGGRKRGAGCDGKLWHRTRRRHLQPNAPRKLACSAPTDAGIGTRCS
eukprot:701558-Rhodomonas_salina.3